MDRNLGAIHSKAHHPMPGALMNTDCFLKCCASPILRTYVYLVVETSTTSIKALQPAEFSSFVYLMSQKKIYDWLV